jgi:hypothetical protein
MIYSADRILTTHVGSFHTPTACLIRLSQKLAESQSMRLCSTGGLRQR